MYPLEKLTVSIFRHTPPKKLIARLKNAGRTVEEVYPGIYRVTGAVYIPAQIVVTSRLPEGEYGALNGHQHRLIHRNINFFHFRLNFFK